MSSPKIAVVIPTIRPEQHEKFVKAWTPLFEKHNVTLITVWDGDKPEVECRGVKYKTHELPIKWSVDANRDLFCRYTDACRNIGFVYAAQLGADYILTLDDDVEPVPAQEYHLDNNWTPSTRPLTNDPIQEHLDVLQKRAPLSWMNTGHNNVPYFRGVPYGIRDEAPVMLSHGVWVGVPDWDGETQLKLQEESRSYSVPPFYVGPIPKGVLFPLCGMNVMIRKEALPYFYFAPMGPDTGIAGLNRFSDIWMGVFLKREFDRLGWACYTGGSTILHTRASDARKNMEQEKLGRQWNEYIWKGSIPRDASVASVMQEYLLPYADKRQRYADLIRSIQGGEE